jgi:hypothetical protein
MIVLVLVIGGWLGCVVRSARIQREAVRAIKSTGGAVAYNWEWSNGNYIPGGKPWAPNLLVGLIGVEFLLDGTHVTDAGLAHLKGLANLSELYLGGTQVTDAGLVQLNGLNRLTRLDLHNTQVTDAGAIELEARLRRLRISTPVISWSDRMTGKRQSSPGMRH